MTELALWMAVVWLSNGDLLLPRTLMTSAECHELMNDPKGIATSDGNVYSWDHPEAVVGPAIFGAPEHPAIVKIQCVLGGEA